MTYKPYLDKFFRAGWHLRVYCSIIDVALSQARQKDSRFERHHILPKAKTLFPEFGNLAKNPWNGVLLTRREHFVCHRLLTRMTSGVQRRSMVYGLKRLSTGHEDYKSSRRYEQIRAEFIEQNRGKNHPSYGRTVSAEERARRSAAAPKTKSATHRQRIGEANARRVWTDESRRRASDSAKQKTLSEQHRANISAQTSGSKNPMAGTKWIHHPLTQESRVVKKEALDELLNAGWALGQSITTRQRNRHHLPD